MKLLAFIFEQPSYFGVKLPENCFNFPFICGIKFQHLNTFIASNKYTQTLYLQQMYKLT